MVQLPAHLRGTAAGKETISRAELAAFQRERIISTLIPVFAKRGYQGSTVDDLLSSGRVGVGNFYSLFGGKEDSFLACFDRVATEASAEVEAASASASAWDQRTYLGLANLLDRICEDPARARIVFVEAQSAGAEATARYNAIVDRAVDWLSRGRAEHPAAADLPASFEQAAVSGLCFYLQQCLLEARRLSPRDLLAETAGLLLEPIVGAARFAQLTRDPAGATSA
jgi:AcrR family transcriptional regulator